MCVHVFLVCTNCLPALSSRIHLAGVLLSVWRGTSVVVAGVCDSWPCPQFISVTTWSMIGCSCCAEKVPSF